MDEDSDGDGILDGTELGRDCSSGATDEGAGRCVPDADGGATTTSMVDPDTDGGGIIDGDEDINRDGAVDDDETDPNDPADDVLLGGDAGVADAGVPDADTSTDAAAGGSSGAGGAGGASSASRGLANAGGAIFGSGGMVGVDTGGAGTELPGGAGAGNDASGTIGGGGCTCDVGRNAPRGSWWFGWACATLALGIARRRARGAARAT